jgi:mannosyltransferase
VHLGYRDETSPRPDDRPEPLDDGGAPGPTVTAPPPAGGTAWQVAAVTAVVVGVVVRFVSHSHLWLDEALSVNLAHLPLGQIPDALRHDGAPPLYYVLLHGWMAVFGTGTVAVRALSGIFAVAALPLIWVAGRRLGGPRVAGAALLLLSASPFAVRYGTEARMYPMLVVLALVGWLAYSDLLERFTWSRAVVLALTTGLAVLTHYWSFYLLAVAVAAAFRRVRRGPKRVEAKRILVVLAAGCALFLPWVPTFLYQLRHTGTPWAGTPPVRSLFDTVFQFSGGFWDPGFVFGLLAWGLIALALLGRPLDGRRIELDLRVRPDARALAVAGFGTLVLAVVAGLVSRSGFAVRYASILFPFVLLLVALGTAVLVDTRVFRAVMTAAVILGFVAILPNVVGERTSAPRVARILRAQARPGDVVAYCPDQLGPSVSRLFADDGLVQLTFPTGGAPTRVDWVDYADRMHAASTAPFAQLLLDRAGPTHDIWLVWSPGYRTLKSKCTTLTERLQAARPDMARMLRISTKNFEHPGLIRYRP